MLFSAVYVRVLPGLRLLAAEPPASHRRGLHSHNDHRPQWCVSDKMRLHAFPSYSFHAFLLPPGHSLPAAAVNVHACHSYLCEHSRPAPALEGCNHVSFASPRKSPRYLFKVNILCRSANNHASLRSTAYVSSVQGRQVRAGRVPAFPHQRQGLCSRERTGEVRVAVDETRFVRICRALLTFFLFQCTLFPFVGAL